MKFNFESLFEKVPADAKLRHRVVADNSADAFAGNVLDIFLAAKNAGVTQYQIVEAAFSRLGIVRKEEAEVAGLVSPGIERSFEEQEEFVSDEMPGVVSEEQAAARLEADGITDDDLAGAFIPVANEKVLFDPATGGWAGTGEPKEEDENDSQ